MDEFMLKIMRKVYKIYETMKKHEKKQEAIGASTSTMNLKGKRKIDHKYIKKTEIMFVNSNLKKFKNSNDFNV